jgi:Hint domain-containing protein
MIGSRRNRRYAHVRGETLMPPVGRHDPGFVAPRTPKRQSAAHLASSIRYVFCKKIPKGVIDKRWDPAKYNCSREGRFHWVVGRALSYARGGFLSRLESDMNEQKKQRTRRNIIRMGAIGASAIAANVGMTSDAKAGNGNGKGKKGDPNCLLRGTTIRTASGTRKIEELAVGDLLPTMFGGTRQIQWIAHYRIKKGDPSKPWPKDARPVRIARSALAPNVPQAELYVTQAHGVFIDGVLVSAEYLVNDATITLCEASESEELEFFHVKLETHDAIYAEGAPVETLLNVDESAVNFADYFRMYGVPTGDETPCLPMLVNWRPGGLKSRFRSAMSRNDRRKRIGAIRDRLEKRAIALSQELEPSF